MTADRLSRLGLSGPWSHGAVESLIYARSLAAHETDAGRRIAFVLTHNAAEIALKTYLSMSQGRRGGRRSQLSSSPRFVDLIREMQANFPDGRIGSVDLESLLHANRIRNVLYHDGNGVNPDSRQVTSFLDAAAELLRVLFAVDVDAEEQVLGLGGAERSSGAPPAVKRARWDEAIPSARTTELLGGYAQILSELRGRGVIRSANAPAGDYAEWLCWKALGGELEPNSTKGHDLTDAQGRTIQVKARVVSNPPKPGQIQSSPFRSWSFSHVAFVLLNDTDYLVRQASLVPTLVFDEGRNLANRVEHVNGWNVHMTPAVMDHPDAVDITAALNRAARTAPDTKPTADGECPHLLAPTECSICNGSGSPPSTRPRGRDRHRWTRDDEIVVAGAYLEGRTVNIPASAKEELARLIETTVASVAMKLANLDAHLSSGAMTSGSRLMQGVADELDALDADTRRRVVAAARERLSNS